MAILSAPKALGNGNGNGTTAKASAGAPPRAEKPRLKVNLKDPLAALDEFEYGDGGPARAYKHLGTHIIRIESVEEGDSEETGDHYFSVNGEIIDTDSDEISAGGKLRYGKTLHRQYPRYFMKMVAETTSAVYQALGEDVKPADVKKYHTRQLTGGEYVNPETGEVAEAQPFDFANANDGAGAFLKIVVRSEAKKDNKGKPTGAYENKVYVSAYRNEQ